MFQNQLMQEQRQQQELDAKLKALAEKAPVEMGGDGYLTAQQYQDAVMKVKGLPTPKRTGQPINWMGEAVRAAMGERTLPKDLSPEQRDRITAINAAKNPEAVAAREKAEREAARRANLEVFTKKIQEELPNMNSAEQVTVREILAEGDLGKIAEVYKTLIGEGRKTPVLKSSMREPFGWPG